MLTRLPRRWKPHWLTDLQPACMSVLRELVSETNVYITEPRPHLALVKQVAEYISWFLNVCHAIPDSALLSCSRFWA